MSGNVSFAINGTLGFQLAGSSNQSLSFVFNEIGIYYSLGGATPSAAFNFGNFGSYATVFDQWRLNKVVCQVYFTSNSSAVNQSAQLLPTIYSVTDVNDTGPLNSVNSALSYGNCRILQMGNSSGPKNGMQTIYLSNPTVEEDALTTSGTVLTAAGRRSPWLNCDNQTIQHNAFKIRRGPRSGTRHPLNTFN